MSNYLPLKIMPTPVTDPDAIKISIMTRTGLTLAAIIVWLTMLGHTTVSAANVQIHVHSDGISGYARNAPLKDVLGRLSAQTGSIVFIDEALSDQRVTFEISGSMPAEYAVRRMIHPLSHAMVYDRIPGQQQLHVAEIKVYSPSKKPSRFVVVEPSTVGSSVEAPMGDIRTASISGAGKFRHGGSLDPRKQVRPPVSFSKGVFGNTRFHIDPSTKGPDYRPTSDTMSDGYAKRHIESQAYQQHSTQSALESSKQHSVANRDHYRRQRALSIQKSVLGN
ncbi:MAG: hypothetical protein PVH22_10605 [Desulfobacteraceae bacterium]|jgi:hypothetical protein